jgi:hypothetical protein
MTPNNEQATVRPGQRIIVDLPSNSTVDLSTFTWFFKGQTAHSGAAATENIWYCCCWCCSCCSIIFSYPINANKNQW